MKTDNCGVIDIENLIISLKIALNDSLVKEAGCGHNVTTVDGEVLYNRIRGILDAITPIVRGES
tara:strand:+ start:562 stop:753 length:192 start_codon:yes stop_codon:yes gene_type:complete